MAIIGYARVSTTGQSCEAQIEQLNAVGVDKIFHEKASAAANRERPQLSALLDYIREGDTVVITKLDRIARSTKDLLEIVEILENKSVSFKVLNIQLDTSSATGKLMLTMLGGIAEFERQLMLERQAEGIARAKSAGKYKGRKPTAIAKSSQVIHLANRGMTRKAIADELNIGVASVYRILKAS